MSYVYVVEPFAVLGVLEPILSQSFPFRIRLKYHEEKVSKSVVPKTSRSTHSKNTIARCETGKSNSVDTSLIEYGRRVADTCSHGKRISETYRVMVEEPELYLL